MPTSLECVQPVSVEAFLCVHWIRLVPDVVHATLDMAIGWSALPSPYVELENTPTSVGQEVDRIIDWINFCHFIVAIQWLKYCIILCTITMH